MLIKMGVVRIGRRMTSATAQMLESTPDLAESLVINVCHNSKVHRPRAQNSVYHIPANPLHYHDIVSIHFNHFYCMEILRQTKLGLSYVSLHISQCG